MIDFKDWLQLREDGDLNADFPSIGPESDKLVQFKPVPDPRPKSKVSKKIDRLFKGKKNLKENQEEKDVGACIFFTDGKSVLLLKRSPDSGNPHTWGLPGGHAEDGETPLQTAKREAKEECGKVKGKLAGQLAHSTTGKWRTFFYKVDQQFKCKLNKEHTKYKWVKFEDISSVKLHPKLSQDIDRFVKFAKKKS